MAMPSPVPQSPWDCLRHTPPRRRIFWTTQLEACGDYVLCGHQCAIPGLAYEDSDDPSSPDEKLRTIKNNDWLDSLVLNILNTRARNDIACPTPAATYGHWSESYRDDNLYVGAKFWNVAEKSYRRMHDAVQAVAATMEADLAKLIKLQLATKVTVTASYKGSNTVAVVVTVTSSITGITVLNLAGAFVAGGWEWR